MDASTAKQVNDALDRVQQDVRVLERRAESQLSVLTDAVSRQKAWSNRQIKLDDDHADHYVRAVNALQELAAKQTLTLQRLLTQNENDADQRTRDDQDLEDTRAQVHELQKTLRELPAQINARDDDVRAARQRLEQRHADLKRYRQKHDAKQDHLNTNVEAFQKVLGVSIDIEPDKIRNCRTVFFHFTNIDADDENRVYTAAVKMGHGTPEACEAISCTPEIPSFTQLRLKLRTIANLREYLAEVRAQFQAVAASRQVVS